MTTQSPTAHGAPAAPADAIAPLTPFSQRLLSGTALALVFGCAMATVALAQDSGAADPEDVEAMEIPAIEVEAEGLGSGYQPSGVQSRKYASPIQDTPQSIIVIPKELIDDRGATSITDVLRTTPGISLGAGEGGTPLGDRAFIRGFDARTDLFVDGARDFGGYYRDPFNLEQIEVVKGPSSVYSGRGSTGGTINLQTKTPRLGAFYDGSVTFGSDWTKRTTIDLNQPVALDGMPGVGVRFNALFHDAGIAGRDEVEQQRFAIAPSITLGLGSPTEFTLTYLHQEQDDIPDYGHPFNPVSGEPIGVGRDNFYGLTDRDHDEVQADIATAVVSHDFNDNLSIRNQFRYGRTAKDIIVTKPEYNTPGAFTVYRSDRSRDSVDGILINQTDLNASFDTGPIGHAFSVGAEFMRETSENRSRAIDDATPASLSNPDPGEPYNGMIVPGDNAAESESWGMAFYAFDTISIGEQIEISGGLRWDGFKTHYTNQNLDEFSRSDSALTWRSGVAWKPVPYGTLYAAYGTSINPSSEGLTLSDSTEELEPEKSVTYELGTKWDIFSERLSLSAAVFETVKTNARTSTGFGAPQVLDGEQRVTGFELGVAGNITDSWALYGGYTLLDSEIVKTESVGQQGNRFQNIPEHSLSLWSTYQATAELMVGAGATYTSFRYANNANDRTLPPYWRFDAMAAYQITENVEVQLNVLNLTDETYYDSTHVGQHALLGPGRSVLVSGNFSF